LGWTRTGDLDAAGRRICQEVRAEVDTVARILELRAAGLTLRAIAAALEAEGRRTKQGKSWHAKTILRVLDREAAGQSHGKPRP
jgi:DNA-binding transcriptional MerR regulator